MTKQRLLLIDGDQLVYQITSAAESETKYELVQDISIPDDWMMDIDTVLYSDYEECLRTVLDKLNTLTSEYDLYFICFSTSPNFRHEVLPTYKGGRVNTRKPLCYRRIVDYFFKGNECRVVQGLEADDVMSIIATNPKYSRYDITIWSQDKDMKQVPGVTVNSTDGRYLIVTTLEEANHFRYLQCLTGDTTDGYKGLKGVGPKSAERMLDGLEGEGEQVYIDSVVSAYMDKGDTVENAYAQINCACILRFSEYDFKTNKPILKGDE